jgi:hypothetical protein
MKPIAKPSQTIIMIFDQNDNEIYRKVTSKSAYRMNRVCERFIRKPNNRGLSYRIDSVAFNSKYNIWSQPR